MPPDEKWKFETYGMVTGFVTEPIPTGGVDALGYIPGYTYLTVKVAGAEMKIEYSEYVAPGTQLRVTLEEI